MDLSNLLPMQTNNLITSPEIFEVSYKEGSKDITEKYAYDFDNMSYNQILACEMHFRFHDKLLDIQITNTTETQIIAQKDTLSKALGFLLMPIESMPADGKEGIKYKKFNQERASEVIDRLTGKDFTRLEACKLDFFTRTGFSSKELTEQYGREIERLRSSMDKETFQQTIQEIVNQSLNPLITSTQTKSKKKS